MQPRRMPHLLTWTAYSGRVKKLVLSRIIYALCSISRPWWTRAGAIDLIEDRTGIMGRSGSACLPKRLLRVGRNGHIHPQSFAPAEDHALRACRDEKAALALAQQKDELVPR
jgi:hypothetical protein